MPTVEISGDIEVWCETCGRGLCHTVSVSGSSIYVPACENCIEVAKSEAYENGKDEGYQEGHDKGYQEGYQEGEEVAA